LVGSLYRVSCEPLLLELNLAVSTTAQLVFLAHLSEFMSMPWEFTPPIIEHSN